MKNKNREISFPVIVNNGNYQIQILEDGTKIRTCLDDKFEPLVPETIDLNISNHCVHDCPFCYIDAGSDKPHGNLQHPILDDIGYGTEIAINYAKHPDLLPFLKRMKSQGVIVNMTVNQKDLEDVTSKAFFELLLENKLIIGLGVSVNSIERLTYINNDNIVYHVIAGITPIVSIIELIQKKKKILILGYKTKGRGQNITPRLERLQHTIKDLLDLNESIISFDNNALEQLDIRNIVSNNVWNNHYMGGEGEFSMYIDTVSEKFFKSSTEEVGYDIGEKSIREIFKQVRSL